MRIHNNNVLDTLIETGNYVEEAIIEECKNYLGDYVNIRNFAVEACRDIGLRLRPFLLRITYESGGGIFQHAADIAAGIELVQISTLIIDDDFDESVLRNNNPTIFVCCGHVTAMSVGTILYSRGISIVARKLYNNKSLKNACSVISLLCDTHADIYLGQLLDAQLEGNTDTSENEYIEVITRTTARFIQSSLVIGAMLWNAPPEIISSLEAIGRALGIAYQIRDDVIDIIGDSECTGKPVGGDIRLCKMRLPVIHALSQLRGEDRSCLERLLRGKKMSDESVEEAVRLVKKTDAIDHCLQRVQQYCNEAQVQTTNLPIHYEELKTKLRVISSLICTFSE